jgi:hypothetical protein
MSDAMYDPMDTVNWMLAGVRAEVLTEAVPTGNGRAKKKTKAQREADRLRYEILCEVLWNVSGRQEPLDELAGRLLEAA